MKLKKTISLISAITLLAGCDFDAGERTTFQDEDNTSLIERTITGSDDGSYTIASCIAVPATWDNAIAVTATGSHQVNGETQPLEVTPQAYPEGVTQLENHYGLPDHSWQCFTDIARDYLSSDSAKIAFSLTPQSDSAMVYTTLGIVADGSRNDHYYGNLAGHQMLTSDTVDAHWVKAAESVELSNIETLELADKTLLFSNALYQDLSSELTTLFSFDDTGLKEIAEIPQSDSLYLVNGIYISHKTYNADIDGDEQDWTDIRYSTDLSDWSDAVTLPRIAQIQWDPREQQYIAFTNDYNSPTDNATYVSDDLVTWTKESWVNFQSPNVAFLADGTAIVETSSRNDPYWIRDANTDQWNPVEITSVEGYEDYVGTIKFSAQRVWENNNRLFTTAIRQLTDVGDSGWDNEQIVFGYSDNGTDWVWTDLGLYDEISSDYDIQHIGENTIIYSTNNALLVSHDKGITWQTKTKPSILVSADKNLETYISGGRIDNLRVVGDYYIGNASLYTGAPSSSSVLFKTKDFESYELLAVSSWIQPLISATQIQFLESRLDGMALQTLTDAASDNDGDYINDTLDGDDDNDGVKDEEDAFPLDSTESLDTDKDGIGNNADTDDDGDGVLDEEDAFPLDATESVDTDKDAIGNNTDTDDDGDGVSDEEDVFPLDSTESVDTDKDAIGNNVDTDDDGDGILDDEDALPLDATESVDTDSDGIGNNADTDDDGDGVTDEEDVFPLDATESQDSDSDGTGDNSDATPDGIVEDIIEESSGGAMHFSWLLVLLTLIRFRKRY